MVNSKEMETKKNQHGKRFQLEKLRKTKTTKVLNKFKYFKLNSRHTKKGASSTKKMVNERIMLQNAKHNS